MPSATPPRAYTSIAMVHNCNIRIPIVSGPYMGCMLHTWYRYYDCECIGDGNSAYRISMQLSMMDVIPIGATGVSKVVFIAS